MGIVTMFGRGVSTTEADSLPITFLSDQYVPPSFALLPSGALWPREPGTELYSLIRALSHTFARIERRHNELRLEADPRTAEELLEEWETALDLDGTDFTTQERRDAIVARLRGLISPNIPNLTALALTLGYVVVITTYADSLFTCVSPCNADLYSEAWVFVWDVTTSTAALDDELDALLALVTPCHTVRRMFFV